MCTRWAPRATNPNPNPHPNPGPNPNPNPNPNQVRRLRAEMRSHPAAQGTALCTVAEGMPSPKEAEAAWGVGEEGDHEATELLSPGGAVGCSPKHFPSKT